MHSPNGDTVRWYRSAIIADGVIRCSATSVITISLCRSHSASSRSGHGRAEHREAPTHIHRSDTAHTHCCGDDGRRTLVVCVVCFCSPMCRSVSVLLVFCLSSFVWRRQRRGHSLRATLPTLTVQSNQEERKPQRTWTEARGTHTKQTRRERGHIHRKRVWFTPCACVQLRYEGMLVSWLFLKLVGVSIKARFFSS